MNVDCQSRVQEIAKRVRRGEYRVDAAAVAGALVRRMVWDDVPELMADPPPAAPENPSPAAAEVPTKLRGLIRVRRLVSPPLPPQTSLSL